MIINELKSKLLPPWVIKCTQGVGNNTSSISCILPMYISQILLKIFFKYKLIYFNWRLITLQYCIGFAIHQHKSATGIHVFLILNPPPSSLPAPSLWVISVHQPQASSIMHRTWTGDLFHIRYYSFPF